MFSGSKLEQGRLSFLNRLAQPNPVSSRRLQYFKISASREEVQKVQNHGSRVKEADALHETRANNFIIRPSNRQTLRQLTILCKFTLFACIGCRYKH